MSRLFARAPIALLALAGLALVASACGDSTSASTTTSTVAAAAPSGNPWPASPAGTFGVEPKLVVPTAAPPAHLVSYDLITGSGAEAKAGDSIEVQYVLASYKSGKVVQASWGGSGPFTFTLGVGQVIKGWDEGVVGMRVGGRRELIIPPKLGYGDESPGAGITPDDTLVFVVDLLKVTPPAS